MCSGLSSITIPNGVTVIGKYAFSECENLTDLIISNSIVKIEGCAFMDCDKLATINYTGTETEWNNIEIDEDELIGITINYNYVISDS